MNDALPGECVEIIVGDPATRDDVRVWAAKTGNRVVVDKEEQGKFRIIVEKVK